MLLRGYLLLALEDQVINYGSEFISASLIHSTRVVGYLCIFIRYLDLHLLQTWNVQ